MKLTRAEKIMAALTGLMFSILVIFYGIIIGDNTSRDDKYRILKKNGNRSSRANWTS